MRMASITLKNKVAIVGAADTEVGMVPDLSATQLYVKAAKLALEDAGITKDQVDGLITCVSFVEPYMYHAEMIAEYLQIFPRYCMTAPSGGGTTIAMIHHAASAIVTGMCNTVLITMGDSQLSGLSRDKAIEAMSGAGHPQFERPYGPPIPAFYALLARAHEHAYGTTAAQRAAVAVACRKHASMNPAAQMRKPITVDDVLNSRMIADPLHLLDCSLVSDGGAAIIMTSAERARDFSKRPVYILGVGEGHAHEHVSQALSLTTSAAKEAGERTYAMAGLGPKDVDVAELYDCFTPVVIIELEDLGFCPKGEGGRFVENGRIELGGELPINTHGGLLSHCHPGQPGSMFSVTEAVKQLRGECGPRQVEDAKIALVHGQGGIMSTHCSMMLGREQV
jgi:acetyl-CoA acetyltransferase